MESSLLKRDLVSGKVTSITFRPLSWVVKTATGESFNCFPDRPRYIPIRTGDYMTAIMYTRTASERILDPEKPPAIEIQHTEESLMRMISKNLYTDWRKCKEQYELLGGRVDEVVKRLDSAAQFFHDTGIAKLPLVDVVDGDRRFVSPDALLHWWFKNVIVRQLELMGVSKKDHYGQYWLNELELLEKIKENPFSVPCLPRELAASIYTTYDSWYNHVTPKMIELGAIMYSAYLKYKNGWSAVNDSYLQKTFPNIKEYMSGLVNDEKMVYEHGCLYFDHTYKVESYLADKFRQLMALPDTPVDDIAVKPWVNDDGTVVDTLSDEQKSAILLALSKPLSIITGGAGTGKSRTMAQLLHNLDATGVEYAVGSFTGKAVSRIKDLMDNVNEEASGTYRRRPLTLHRLIREGRGMEDEKVPIKYLVIDEASMVSSSLMYDVLSTYSSIDHVILVGDVNQLQPIEWGSFFVQLVSSGRIPVARLHTNFRTYIANGEKDGIILNANALLTTKPRTQYSWHTGSNFSLYTGSIPETVNIVRSCINAGITTKQLVVLCPYVEGVDDLNKAIQPVVTQGKPFIIDSRGKKWAIGDRVRMTKNHKKECLSNGDLGDVVDVVDTSFTFQFGKVSITLSKSECSEYLVTKDQFYVLVKDCQGVEAGEKTDIFKLGPRLVVVKFRDPQPKRFLIKEEENTQKELEEFTDNEEVSRDLNTSMLAHAYALTVNTSQGSEWDFVLISLPKIGRGTFINRNLFYTALTRAKRCVWIVTNLHLQLSVAVTNRPSARVDNLGLRLSDLPLIQSNADGLSSQLREMDICDSDMFFDDFDDDDYGVGAF
jgi:hypothetical protein